MADLVGVAIEVALSVVGGGIGAIVFGTKLGKDVETVKRDLKEHREDSKKHVEDKHQVVMDRVEDLQKSFDAYEQRDREEWQKLNRTLGHIEGALGLK